MMKTVRLTTS